MRSRRRVPAFIGAALLSVLGVAAVAQEPAAVADARGPQFLLAMQRPGRPPVVVDAGSVPALRRRIALDLRDVSRTEALAAISRASGLQLVYANGVVPAEGRVRLRAEVITVAAALTEALLGAGVDVLVASGGNVVLVKRPASRAPAAGRVQGRVTDATTGRSLAGAEVFLERTKWRTETDTAGWFRLVDVDTGSYMLVVRRLGYGKQSRRIMVREAAEDTVTVALAPVAKKLDELVTTATGRQRRRDLGNAITTIKADSVLEHAPIKSLTDLLEHRVPGLTVQHTSGAPGDPARLRLRGLGSVLRSNDPVVVVDGVRVYAAQSEVRSGNLTNLLGGTSTPAPSPLDQIDPNTIDKIEVFKGPSAATLYGADAANGVIVVTTKRGKPGPTQWNARLTRSHAAVLGRYPTGYYRWGHSATAKPYGSDSYFCTIVDLQCVQDSLVTFQALTIPALTVLGNPGRRTSLALTASGGTQALTYSVTGSYSDELGNFKLPDFEVQRFQDSFSRPVPDWMRRSHRYTTWGVQSSVTARLSAAADVTLLTSLSRSTQERTSLENQVAKLAATYIDTLNGRYYRSNGIGSDGGRLNSTSSVLADYYNHITASTITLTTALNANWRPRSWFTASGNAGLNIVPRADENLQTLLPNGSISRGTGRSVVSTFGVQGDLRKPLAHGFVFATNVGANLQTTSINDLASAASGIVPGTSSMVGAQHFTSTDQALSTSVFGWYVEPRITGQRLSLSTGLRLDGGSANGTRVSGLGGAGLLALPKLNGSWVISEEPWFPFKTLFSSLRLRGAYGHAQTQPGPADRFRLYGGSPDPRGYGALSTLGNTQLRPERSRELEGGVDADLLDGRASVELTGYRKLSVDALMNVALPGSVNGGGAVVKNIGNVLNTGVELTLGLTPVRSAALSWSTLLVFNRKANTLVKLGPGVDRNPAAGLVEGYPVGSRWEKPIRGFADANGDGVLERSEIQVGDSAVFVGRLYPTYQLGLNTDVVLFRNVHVSASVSYDAGQTQKNALALTNWVLNRALVDPNAPLSEQAKFVASVPLSSGDLALSPSTDYGVLEQVSTFRFTALSLNYTAPARAARLIGAQLLTVAVQGSNLGLHSTYSGKDPDVNAWSPGESIVDTGQLPQPREWSLAVILKY